MDIFDILGPVMVGPSSSHTAGAARIGCMARTLLGSAPVKANIYLHGSFAETGSGHGTDRALLGGLLGFHTDDKRIRDSFRIASERGIEYHFIPNDTVTDIHPNSVDILMENEAGTTMLIRGESLGGGKVRISRINNVEVEFTGEYSSVIVVHQDQLGLVAHITAVLSHFGVNIAFMRLFRESRGQTAYTLVEVDGDLPKGIKEMISDNHYVHDVMIIEP